MSNDNTAKGWQLANEDRRGPESIVTLDGESVVTSDSHNAEGWSWSWLVINPKHQALLLAAPDLLEALESFVKIASEAAALWDAGRDMKVGKLLLALAGYKPRYRADIDKIHAAIAKAKGEPTP